MFCFSGNESFEDHDCEHYNYSVKDIYISNNCSILLQEDMRFGVGQVISICGYGVIFLVSAIANLMVLKILIARYRKTKSRGNLLLCHLAIADLLVSRIMLQKKIR